MGIAYRDKEVVGVFVRFRAPLQPVSDSQSSTQVERLHCTMFATQGMSTQRGRALDKLLCMKLR
jgi:hypothetical protein